MSDHEFNDSKNVYICERLKNDPGYAKDFLFRCGITDENGELSEFYRTPEDYRPCYSIEYVKGLYEKLDAVNKYKLDEIDWTLDGKAFKFAQEELEELKFTGLTTTGIIRDLF